MNKLFLFLSVVISTAIALPAQQKSSTDCSGLPDHAKLKAALQQVVKEGQNGNGGLGNQMWGVVVNKDGIVCAVVFTGPDRFAQWAGSRLIAAEKANTANALSLDNFALSTANLYSAVQPGQSLYSLIQTNPPNPTTAGAGPPEKFGQPDDPMVGKAIGGVVTFGGGFALYSSDGKKVGGFGAAVTPPALTTSLDGRRGTRSVLTLFRWASVTARPTTSSLTSRTESAPAASAILIAKAASPAKRSPRS